MRRETSFARRVGLGFAAGALLAATCLATISAAEILPVSRGAAKLATLLDELQRSYAAGSSTPVRFDLSESEVNEYIVFALRRTPRPGLAGATVRFFPGNYVATLTTVDFTAVEQWKPGTIPALLKPVLSGQRKVQLDLRFAPAGGLAGFRVEKAEFEGVPIPPVVVNEVIRVVAARQPEQYDTTKPVPLPFGLKTFWTTPGRVLGQNY